MEFLEKYQILLTDIALLQAATRGYLITDDQQYKQKFFSIKEKIGSDETKLQFFDQIYEADNDYQSKVRTFKEKAAKIEILYGNFLDLALNNKNAVPRNNHVINLSCAVFSRQRQTVQRKVNRFVEQRPMGDGSHRFTRPAFEKVRD